MKRRPRNRRLIVDINITPFTDVILVLLIIFMMVTPLLSVSAIPVRLPEAQKSRDVPKSVVITIDEAGEAYIDKKQYSLRYDLGILKFNLSSMINENRDLIVTINSDENVKYDFVVKVLNILNQLGVQHVMLGTEQRQ